MKRNAPGEEHARKLSQGAIHLDRHSAFSRSECAEAALIVSVVLNNLQPLHDERSQQFNSFFFSDWSMNTGRKDDCQLCWRNTRLHKTPHEKIYDLRTRSGASCIRNNNQYRIIATCNFIKWWGSNRSIERSTNLKIAERQLTRLAGANDRESFCIKIELSSSTTVSEFNSIRLHPCKSYTPKSVMAFSIT